MTDTPKLTVVDTLNELRTLAKRAEDLAHSIGHLIDYPQPTGYSQHGLEYGNQLAALGKQADKLESTLMSMYKDAISKAIDYGSVGIDFRTWDYNKDEAGVISWDRSNNAGTNTENDK